jgi:predicted AlkP superfamily phosphohydrolase/phosphomutase
MRRKVAVIGLDSVPPELLFEKLLDQLPNFQRIYELGLHGRLRTCHPPITVPAWMVMMTGRNPGKLGIYGFRHRRGFSYSNGYIVNSADVHSATVWDILAANGLKSIVLGVPPGYPPKPIKDGNVVSCFLTPGIEKEFTYPASLKQEILSWTRGKYLFDVTFRTEDRAALKKELFEMTEMRFKVAEQLARKKEWDFFVMHEIGFDRLHHAFWKFFDQSHPKHVRGNQYEHVDLEYYKLVDSHLGRLLEILGDECVTFVVSDHGSKAMKGAFCVNEWLEQEGYLTFRKKPSAVIELEKAEVDWRRTEAWGWGGYYARIFFNVRGREPDGVVAQAELQAKKKSLSSKIMAITDDRGRRMSNEVYEPEEIYGTAVGDKPDLMVYFDNLNWRSAGTVGHISPYLTESDKGPDDSVHSMEGIFMMYNPKRNLHGKELRSLHIEDIGPTLLRVYGLDYGDAANMDGRVLKRVVQNCRRLKSANRSL